MRRAHQLRHAPMVAVLVALTIVATPASASTHHRYLKESDSGRTIHVVRGDKISVRLPGGNGGYHRPRSTDATVVERIWAAGGYPSDEDARATFVARHAGRADLTSTTDYTCLHTDPRCLPPQRQWIVHVVVG
jgi:hypothetical protein